MQANRKQHLKRSLTTDRKKTGQRHASLILTLVYSFFCVASPFSWGAEPVNMDVTEATAPAISVDAANQQLTTETEPDAATMDAFLNDNPLSLSSVQSLGESTATGRVFYVSKTGNDGSDGTQSNPFRSIQHAIYQLQAGDTLRIMEGIYQESADFVKSGSADGYITIEGVGNVVIDGEPLNDYEPIFDTKGFDYLRFKNLSVKNSRDAVEVSPGSSYIEVDGLTSDRNHFAVKINGGDHVTVRNVTATNSRNAFRTEGNTHDVLFENIEAYGSKDIYSGYESRYRNGDGFILESGNNITLRNIISGDHWDAGFDVKASNVMIENVVSFGNKNNFKIWGNNITIRNSVSRNAKYMADDPVSGEGNGINARMGSVTIINSTFVDNESFDIKADNDGGQSTVTVINSIIARQSSSGKLFTNVGGRLIESNNLWYEQGRSGPEEFSLSGSSLWANPGFVNWGAKDFHLQSASPAINFGTTDANYATSDLDGNQRVVGSKPDLGAFEYQDGTTPVNDLVFNGLAEGDTVSGTIAVLPDQSQHPGIARLVYLMDGTAVTDTATSPFALGGSEGFDTKTMTDGTHVMSGTCYMSDGTTHPFNVNFSVKNTTTPPPTGTGEILGLTEGATVSGVIKVQPNLELNPDVRKVFYYLNGSQSGKYYDAPFTWGGSNGFDTRTLSDGNYTLSGSYTTASGDHNFSISFKVANNSTPPAVEPVLIGLAKDETVSGSIFVKPDVARTPDVSKVTYLLDGANAGIYTSSPFQLGGTTGFDTKTISNGNHVLSGIITTSSGDYPFSVQFNVNNSTTPPQQNGQAFNEVAGQVSMEGESLFNATTVNGQSWQAADAAGTASAGKGLLIGPDLGRNVSDISQSARADFKFYVNNPGTYYVWIRGFAKDGASDSLHVGLDGQLVNGGSAVSGFIYDGSSSSWTSKNMQGSRVSFTVSQPGEHSLNLWMREDGLMVDKILLTKDAGYLPQGFGPAESARVADSGGDTSAPVISAVSTANVTANSAIINWTTNEASNSLVEYRIKGSSAWVAAPVQTAMVTSHSVTLTSLNPNTMYEFRVKSTDAAGNLATQTVLSSFTTKAETTACTTALCGVSSGQTVSGVIKVQPNLQMNPDVRKVFYYLNGSQSGKYYEAPFIWGGVNGFDTNTLANGTYTLSGSYADSSGDHSFSIQFTVANGTTPPPSVTDVTFTGLQAGETVSGNVVVQPDLTANPNVTRVTYLLDGKPSTDAVASPFTWGGANGFDTTTLANGAHTLSGTAVTSAGTVTFSIPFNVNNMVTPPVDTNSDVLGLQNGAIVNGVIQVGPNLTKHPDVQKVAYYLNGTKSGKVYQSPFFWGGTTGNGTSGFDTRTLKNGTYTLSVVYTDGTGDHEVKITFTVQN